MKNIISVKDLRLNLQKYADKAQKGKSFLVVKRSRPIFQIMPIDEVDEVEDAKGWKAIVDFTKIRKGGVPIDKVIDSLGKLIRKDRGQRVKTTR